MISANSRNPHSLRRIEAREPNYPNRGQQADRDGLLLLAAIFGPWALIGAVAAAVCWWLA